MIEERRIQVDGLPIRYLEAGEGPPLVLLHALGESALDWKWVLPALARTNRVYAPDPPGFGGSSKPAADYSPTFFARSVSAYLDTLGSSGPRWQVTRSAASSPYAWRSPSLKG